MSKPPGTALVGPETMNSRQFQTRDAGWEARVRNSFARQAFMGLLGAEIVHLAPGEVDIALPHRSDLTQQHGYFHAGATTSIADSAASYAALSLFPAGRGVLTAEFKINLLNPARGECVIARGRVVKPGRTLTICRSDVFGRDAPDGAETHLVTGLFTMIAVDGLDD